MSVSKRREREREARRNLILDAAQQAFLSSGFDAATMDDVAELAQLGKGTLYNYFNTKEELLLGVVVRHQRDIIGRFEEAAAKPQTGLMLVRAMMLEFIEHLSNPPGRLKMAMSRWASGPQLHANSRCCELFNDNVRHVVRLFNSAVVRGQQDGSICPNCDAMAATMSLWAAMLGTMLHRLQLASIPEPNPIAGLVPSYEESVDFYLQALRPALAPPRVSSTRARSGSGHTETHDPEAAGGDGLQVVSATRATGQ